MHVFRNMRCSLAWMAVFANCSLAAGEWTTLLDNGPSVNRVDIVVLGDGYTESDLANGIYEQHIDSYLEHMFAASPNSEPFHRYRNFFNVHAVEVVSNESGADIPPSGVFRDTALDAKYFGDGVTERLLTIDKNKANSVRNAALVDAEFAAEMQYVVVNDTKYGGSGGSYAVFAGGSGSSSEIALHEVVHSFSNLADEYTYGADPSHYDGPEPTQVNVTADPTGAKWARWLNYNQPGVGVIGAYEGAKYHKTGMYRPSIDSKMRNLNRPFNAVSREKIVLDIYELVDPLDTWTDNTIPLVDPSELSVTSVDEEVIEFEWFVDGALVLSADQSTFDPTAFGYGAGEYEVTLRAFDPTGFDPVDGWVRLETSKLEQYVSWQVTISAEEPTPAFPGDYDGDGLVDADDYAEWKLTFGDVVEVHSGADGNGDGVVNLADYNVWRSHLGMARTPATSSASQVPEPAGVVMAVVVLLLVVPYRAKRLRRAVPDSFVHQNLLRHVL